jgi:hypothetical protein
MAVQAAAGAVAGSAPKRQFFQLFFSALEFFGWADVFEWVIAHQQPDAGMQSQREQERGEIFVSEHVRRGFCGRSCCHSATIFVLTDIT